jgi:glutamyl-tRNA synthetase
LAVVVDDANENISQVIRGDDLLASTPRQIALYRALDRPVPSFAHLGLVLDADGQRMATRDGATSIASLRKAGRSAEELIGELACSLGITQTSAPIRAEELISSFELSTIRRAPFTWKSKG